MSFKKVQPGAGPAIFVVDDDEIDLETILNEDPVPIPRAARYTGELHLPTPQSPIWLNLRVSYFPPIAHWLAIEGVQPLIPENPPPDVLTNPETEGQSSSNPASTKPSSPKWEYTSPSSYSRRRRVRYPGNKNEFHGQDTS